MAYNSEETDNKLKENKDLSTEILIFLSKKPRVYKLNRYEKRIALELELPLDKLDNIKNTLSDLYENGLITGSESGVDMYCYKLTDIGKEYLNYIEDKNNA